MECHAFSKESIGDSHDAMQAVDAILESGWLAEHDREVAANALEDASEDVPPLPSGHQRSYVKHWLRDREMVTRASETDVEGADRG